MDDVVVDCRLHQFLIFPFLFLYQQIYELRTRISKRKHYLHKMHNLLFSKKNVPYGNELVEAKLYKY